MQIKLSSFCSIFVVVFVLTVVLSNNFCGCDLEPTTGAPSLSCLQEMTITLMICRLDTRGRREATVPEPTTTTSQTTSQTSSPNADNNQTTNGSREASNGRNVLSQELFSIFGNKPQAASLSSSRQRRDHLDDFRRDCCRNSVNNRPKLQCRPTRLCPEKLGSLTGLGGLPRPISS